MISRNTCKTIFSLHVHRDSVSRSMSFQNFSSAALETTMKTKLVLQ